MFPHSVRLLKDCLRANKYAMQFVKDKEGTDMDSYFKEKVEELTKAIEVLEGHDSQNRT
jgi:hypothetical protein